MWDRLRDALGLGESSGGSADDGTRAQERRALLEDSARILVELESDEQALAAREAELTKLMKSELAQGDRVAAGEHAVALKATRSELQDQRARLRETRVAHERALALSKAADDEAVADETARLAGANSEDANQTSPFDLGVIARGAAKLAGRAASKAQELWALVPKGPGVVAFQQGRYTDVITQCDRALQVNPKDANAHCNRGAALSCLKRPGEALADFDMAIKLAPRHALAWSNRADSKLLVGDRRGAEADATEAIRLDPKLALAFYNRGRARRAQLDEERALEDLAESIRLQPGIGAVRRERASLALDRGLLDLALEDADAYVARHRLSDSLELRARVRRARRELALALEDATAAILVEPTKPARYIFRSEIYRERQERDAANADLERACRLEPDDARALVYRANDKLADEDFEGARSLASEAIRRKLDLHPAFLTRFLANLCLGEREAAVADLARARVGYSNVAPFVDMEAILDVARDPWKAITGADEALQSGYLNAAATRSRARAALGDLEGAREDVNACVRARPLFAFARAMRGRLRLLGGDDRGREDLAASVALDARSWDATLWLGVFGGDRKPLEALAAMERWEAHLARHVVGRVSEEALLAEANRAPERRRAERLAQAHGLLGLIAERAGDVPRAHRHFEACVATGDQESAEFMWARARLAQHREKNPLADSDRIDQLLAVGLLEPQEHAEARRFLLLGKPG